MRHRVEVIQLLDELQAKVISEGEGSQVRAEGDDDCQMQSYLVEASSPGTRAKFQVYFRSALSAYALWDST